MQLNITTDYAIRMMMFVTAKDGTVSSAEISKNLRIPRDYAYTIGRKLKQVNYIRTVAGVTGGFALLKAPDEISLL